MDCKRNFVTSMATRRRETGEPSISCPCMKPLPAVSALLLSSFCGGVSCFASTSAFAAVASSGPAALTQRLVVQFRTAPAPAHPVAAKGVLDLAYRVRALGERKSLRLAKIRETGKGAVVVALPAPMSMDEARRAARVLADDPAVAHAEVDVRVFALQAADPLFASQWNLPGPADAGGSIGGSNVTTVWPLTSGIGVTVAVIDTGHTRHDDLDAAWLPGHDFVSGEPGGTFDTANDGDGRDHDAADPGDWCVSGGAQQPNSWHGTAVAGIIAAQVNGYGGVGLAPGVRLLPVRAIGRCGGYMSDVVDAMRWAAGLPVPGAPSNPNPARILNLSLGSAADSPCSVLQQQAVDEIVAANVMIVAAAGNEGMAAMGSPANCLQVVAVAAHTRQGELAAYSNFHAGITLTAPGGAGSTAVSAILAASNAGTTSPGLPEAARAFAGTSAATPHVAAAAALLWSQDPARPLAEIRNALTGSARPWAPGSACLVGTARGRCGAGMLDVGAAIARLGSQVAVDIAASADTLAGNSTVSVGATARSHFAPSQLRWRWTQTSGAPARLDDAATPTLRLTVPPHRTTIGLRVTVTDPAGGQTIDDTLVEVNNPPVAAAGTPILAKPGDPVARRIVAVDPDGDAIRYALLQGPEGMTIGRADGELAWIADRVGSQVARIGIEDAFGVRGKDVEIDVTVSESGFASTASPFGTSGSGGGGSFGWAGGAVLGLALASLLRRRPSPPGPR